MHKVQTLSADGRYHFPRTVRGSAPGRTFNRFPPSRLRERRQGYTHRHGLSCRPFAVRITYICETCAVFSRFGVIASGPPVCTLHLSSKNNFKISVPVTLNNRRCSRLLQPRWCFTLDTRQRRGVCPIIFGPQLKRPSCWRARIRFTVEMYWCFQIWKKKIIIACMLYIRSPYCIKISFYELWLYLVRECAIITVIIIYFIRALLCFQSA